MKHTRFLFSTLVLCGTLLWVPAAAQAVDFNILAGLWDPDDGGDSVGVGVRLAFFDQLQLEVGAGYYEDFEPRFRIERVNNRFEVRSADLEVIPIEAGVRYNFGDARTGFYLGGGAGWYMVDSSNRANVDDELGLYGKAGWQYEHLFLEVLYRDIDGTFEGLEFDDRRFGNANVDLSGFGFQLGWRF